MERRGDDVELEESKETLGPYKIILVGDSSVGKTCIINRYMKIKNHKLGIFLSIIISKSMKSKFIDRLPATLTGEFESKTEKIPNTNKSMKLNVWDTFGEEKFRGYLKMYFKQASAVIICFDLTSKEGFSKLPEWLAYINEHLKRDDAVFVLCGCKSDLEDRNFT